MNENREFEWFRDMITAREELIKEYQDTMLHSDRVTDYWWYLNRINKVKNELWVLREMAKEKGIYPVGE